MSRPLHRALLLLAAGALSLAPSIALTRPAHKHPTQAAVHRAEPARAMARSVGSPNDGHLEGGVRLDPSDSLQYLAGHDRRWGLPQLVGLLDRGARRVAGRHPGSVMRVGDLSRKGGGDVDGHHSHESGRDADVAFYVTTADGKPQSPSQLVTFDELGHAGSLRFDLPRNWALIEAWLTDDEAEVSHIFVAAPLRERLLAFAQQIGAPSRLRARAAQALVQPRRGAAHDDHFHVRIACPKGQRGTCIESATRESHEHGRKARAASRSRPPLIARARNRAGTTGRAAPPLLAAVPAPDDFAEARADADEVASQVDEGGEPRLTR